MLIMPSLGFAGNHAAAGGGGGGGPTSTQWRVYLTDEATGGGTLVQILEIEMRGSVGGADQCTGGSASASTTFSGRPASAAFDNSYGSDWVPAATPNAGDWIQYTFASPVSVAELGIAPSAASTQAPKGFNLEYYNGSTWVAVLTQTGLTSGWTSNTLRLFTVP